MKQLIYLILSTSCFLIFKAYLMVNDKEMNAVLLVGLYMFIGMWAYFKLLDGLSFKTYGKYNIGSYFYPFIIIGIPISAFFIDRLTNLTSILIIQLIVLIILDYILQSCKNKKNKKNVNKN